MALKVLTLCRYLTFLDSMNQNDLPDPRLLAEEAEVMPPKLPLRNYRDSMMSLRDKGYSYREIAEWLAERLGIEVNRNQVAYVVAADPAVQALEEQEEAAEELDDRVAEEDARA